MGNETLMDKISRGIASLALGKKDIDIKLFIKKAKFKLKGIKEDSKVSVGVGNEGKIFDSIIVGKNVTGDKIVVLVKKSKEFYVLLDSTNSELEDIVDKINLKEHPELKNKSMEISFLESQVISILEK